MITMPWYIAALCLYGVASIGAIIGYILGATFATNSIEEKGPGYIPGRWYYP